MSNNMDKKDRLDEEILVVKYNSKWANDFLEEKQRIIARFGKVIKGIEHNGSTAVPGLSAKPIVDILIGIDDIEQFLEL